uniref:Uncharacterized protein n=1 Tax=Rhipicephalus zambeziensis TaxID=60191 RepID=A0A224YA03_9ACAR
MFCTRAAFQKCCFGYSAVPLIVRIFATPATYVISGLCCIAKVCVVVSVANYCNGSDSTSTASSSFRHTIDISLANIYKSVDCQFTMHTCQCRTAEIVQLRTSSWPGQCFLHGRVQLKGICSLLVFR